jgi:hypothetical protein
MKGLFIVVWFRGKRIREQWWKTFTILKGFGGWIYWWRPLATENKEEGTHCGNRGRQASVVKCGTWVWGY